ncbi:MAG: hypothetical protein MZV65_35940 [Chromatiales bacterium]|nr:hypothetical protein [Chromatiales bacterium]
MLAHTCPPRQSKLPISRARLYQRDHVVVTVGMLADAAMNIDAGVLAVRGELEGQFFEVFARSPAISAHSSMVFWLADSFRICRLLLTVNSPTVAFSTKN